MRIAIVLVVVAACGKSDSSTETKPTEPTGGDTVTPGKPGEPAKPAPGFENLNVTVDGKPVPMGRAFIKRVSPDHWRLQIGDREGSCEELLSGVTNRHPGATSFVATIRTVVAPDGKDSTVVTDFWSAGHPTQAKFGTASITGAVTKGSKVTIELGKIVDIDGSKKSEVSGSFTALGCGDQPRSDAGVPKAQHVTAASITIAGKRLELASAVLHGSDLVLSTGPKDCSAIVPEAQVVLAHANGQWELTGTWISEKQIAVDKTGTMHDIKLSTKNTKGDSVDGPVTTLVLGGSGAVGKYPILLEGTIEAIDCPET